jgi:hypothetical protein
MKGKSTATGLLTMVALVVLGAFSAGSASAESFLWTGALPGLLLVLSQSLQILTVGGALQIACEHFGAHGILSNGKGMSTKEVTISGRYTKCFSPQAPTLPVTVSPASFLLNANGSAAVVGAPIVVSIGGEANCSLKVNNDGGNANLTGFKFLNLKEDVLVDVNVPTIKALSSNEPCGPAGIEINSTYTGLLLASVDGGTLKWDTTP